MFLEGDVRKELSLNCSRENPLDGKQNEKMVIFKDGKKHKIRSSDKLLRKIFSYLDSSSYLTVLQVSSSWKENLIKKIKSQQESHIKKTLLFIINQLDEEKFPEKISLFNSILENNEIKEANDLSDLKRVLDEIKKLLIFELMIVDKETLTFLQEGLINQSIPYYLAAIPCLALSERLNFEINITHDQIECNEKIFEEQIKKYMEDNEGRYKISYDTFLIGGAGGGLAGSLVGGPIGTYIGAYAGMFAYHNRRAISHMFYSNIREFPDVQAQNFSLFFYRSSSGWYNWAWGRPSRTEGIIKFELGHITFACLFNLNIEDSIFLEDQIKLQRLLKVEFERDANLAGDILQLIEELKTISIDREYPDEKEASSKEPEHGPKIGLINGSIFGFLKMHCGKALENS